MSVRLSAINDISLFAACTHLVRDYFVLIEINELELFLCIS